MQAKRFSMLNQSVGFTNLKQWRLLFILGLFGVSTGVFACFSLLNNARPMYPLAHEAISLAIFAVVPSLIICCIALAKIRGIFRKSK